MLPQQCSFLKCVTLTVKVLSCFDISGPVATTLHRNISENLCLQLCTLGGTDCVHWMVRAVYIGRYRLCTLGGTDCVHWAVRAVYIGRYRLCTLDGTGCVHWTVQTVYIGRYRLCTLDGTDLQTKRSPMVTFVFVMLQHRV
jgi:hypothetical protein